MISRSSSYREGHFRIDMAVQRKHNRNRLITLVTHLSSWKPELPVMICRQINGIKHATGNCCNTSEEHLHNALQNTCWGAEMWQPASHICTLPVQSVYEHFYCITKTKSSLRWTDHTELDCDSPTKLYVGTGPDTGFTFIKVTLSSDLTVRTVWDTFKT